MAAVPDPMPVRVLEAPVFRGLSREARAALSASARARLLGRGEVLARQGEPAEHFYVVETGSLKLTQTTAQGAAVIVRFVGPLQPFGAVAALDEGRYPVTAQAAEPTRVWAWLRATMRELAARSPELRVNLMQAIADHLTDALARLGELATERVPERLARALLRLARHNGRETTGGLLIDHPLTRQDLAELAGTTVYTASRTLARWAEAGIVATHRRRLLIRRPADLARLAGPEGAEDDSGR